MGLSVGFGRGQRMGGQGMEALGGTAFQLPGLGLLFKPLKRSLLW